MLCIERLVGIILAIMINVIDHICLAKLYFFLTLNLSIFCSQKKKCLVSISISKTLLLKYLEQSKIKPRL